jgi:hypothetical protein
MWNAGTNGGKELKVFTQSGNVCLLVSGEEEESDD